MARVDPFECQCPACIGEKADSLLEDDEALLRHAALVLRWAHSITAVNALEEDEQQDALERIAVMAGSLHETILEKHPEFNDFLPRGGINAPIWQ